jgi:hypothetical protein
MSTVGWLAGSVSLADTFDVGRLAGLLQAGWLA